MRVQMDSPLGATDGAASIAAAGSNSTTDRERAGGSRDCVTVSLLTTTLNTLASDHAARLQQIARSVADGSYRSSSTAIAGAIVGYCLASK